MDLRCCSLLLFATWGADTGNRDTFARLLLQRGDVNVNAADENGWTPMRAALMNENRAVEQLRKQKGVIVLPAEEIDTLRKEYLGWRKGLE